MTDQELFALIQSVDPEAKRIPPGVRAIAEAIAKAERERIIGIVEGLGYSDFRALVDRPKPLLDMEEPQP